MSGLRQGVGDGAERVADLWTKHTHNGNHNNCHEYHDDRILHEALALSLGANNIITILSNEKRPILSTSSG